MSEARLDRWLFCARFYRSRELAKAACESGRIRINGQRVEKPGREIRPGDILTLPRPREAIAVRILALAARRGKAIEAQGLYELLDPGAPAP